MTEQYLRDEEVLAMWQKDIQEARENEIREKAYLLWKEAGCPPGDGVDFWMEAERKVLEVEARWPVPPEDSYWPIRDVNQVLEKKVDQGYLMEVKKLVSWFRRIFKV